MNRRMCSIRREKRNRSSSILITALFLLVTLIECRSFNTSPLLLTTSSSSSSSFEVWNRIHRGGDLTTRTPSSSSSALGAGAAIGSAASPVIVHALSTFMKQNPFAAAFGICKFYIHNKTMECFACLALSLTHLLTHSLTHLLHLPYTNSLTKRLIR